jgi:hypothetical protein
LSWIINWMIQLNLSNIASIRILHFFIYNICLFELNLCCIKRSNNGRLLWKPSTGLNHSLDLIPGVRFRPSGATGFQIFPSVNICCLLI